MLNLNFQRICLSTSHCHDCGEWICYHPLTFMRWSSFSSSLILLSFSSRAVSGSLCVPIETELTWVCLLIDSIAVTGLLLSKIFLPWGSEYSINIWGFMGESDGLLVSLANWECAPKKRLCIINGISVVLTSVQNFRAESTFCFSWPLLGQF